MRPERAAPYRLSLIGPWDLRGPDGARVRSVLSQPKRLCLLAYLATRGEPVSRSTLVALFWPDRDEERARNALSQALHYLRRSMSRSVVESVEGDRLRVGAESVWFDARALLEASERDGNPAAAEPGHEVIEAARRARQGADFFEGWNSDDSQPLQEWLDEVRRRVHEAAASVAGDEAGVAKEYIAASPGVGRAEPSPPTAGGAARGLEGDGQGPLGRTDGASPARSPIRRRVAWAGGGVAVGVLLTLGALRAGLGSVPGTPSAPGTFEIAVLLPRVTVLDGETGIPEEALAEAIHDEVVARLGGLAGYDVVSVPFETEVRQLVRALDALGSSEVPDWVVSIGVRGGGDQARVVALLLRGPEYTEASVPSAVDYPLPSERGARVLIDLPRRIADDVVEGLARLTRPER